MNINRCQMLIADVGGTAHPTDWSLVYPDGSSPGLLRARLRERRGLQVLDAMKTGLALVKVRLYSPRGGWPAWGIEFLEPLIDIADDEPMPLSLARFCELTGWVPPGPGSLGNGPKHLEASAERHADGTPLGKQNE